MSKTSVRCLSLEVFPFFFVNGAAALVGVRCRTFIAATSVSCIPGSVIYTTAGGALANLLHKMSDEEDRSRTFNQLYYTMYYLILYLILMKLSFKLLI